MVEVFSILIIVAGFTLIHYLHTKHVMRLELLLKARDIYEVKELYKQFEQPKIKQEITSDPPVNLQELVADVGASKGPDGILEMFRRGNDSKDIA